MIARRCAMGLLLAAVALTTAAAAVAAPARISGRLAAALEAAPAPDAATDGRLAVWVRFVDRDLSGAALDAALQQAQDRLPERLRERRARMKTPVGAADLPLVAAWVDAVSATGATLRRESRWLNAASFRATPAQIEAIAALPWVHEVELVARLTGDVRIPDDVTPIDGTGLPGDPADKAPGALDYGHSKAMLDAVNIPLLHQQGFSGEGVTIAILDSGFLLEHESLQHVDVVAAWDFVNDDAYVQDQRNDPEGAADHGTQVLGTLTGYSRGTLIGPAYGASVILAKTEDIGGENRIEEDNWIAALEWAVGLGADVVNSSVGYFDWYDWSDLDGGTSPMTIAADMAALRGTVVVVGVGMMRFNEEWPHILVPADGRHVLAVGMADANGYVSNWSSPGPTFDGRVKPDVLALGTSNLTPIPWTTDLYYNAWGTDMAVPLVTGAAALLLQQNPTLTPLQVNEALRETASRALLPDNDYGWGVIDAYGAGRYWSPAIAHTPLKDTQPPGAGAFTINATITSRTPLLDGAQGIYYRVNSGDWKRAGLTAAGGGAWTGTIPPQSPGRTVQYYFTAANDQGLSTIWPDGEMVPYFSFRVGQDTSPPVISHVPLTNQTGAHWPPLVKAGVTDNGTVGSVSMIYTVNGGVPLGPEPMVATADGWALPFPIGAGVLPAGTSLSYVLIARDSAAAPNIAYAGPFAFKLVEHLGSVLIIDDHWNAKSAAAPEANGRGATQVVHAEKTGASDFAAWLTGAGYLVQTVTAEDFVPEDLLDRDVVFYTSGNHLNPLVYQEMRDALIDWTDAGGRILLEGGEIGYACISTNAYPEFAASVLHATEFLADDTLELHTNPDGADHPLLNRPHAIPSPLRVNVPSGVTDWGASDGMGGVDPDAAVVMHSVYALRSGGIIAWDDNTGPAAGQIVYLPVDLAYVEDSAARLLLENALAYLLADEPGGPSSISGRVTLSDRSDHAGVTVTVGRAGSVVTGADGTYRLSGLWGGSYEVVATKPGYSTARSVIDLAEGEQAAGRNLTLVPVIEVSGAVWPNQAIPDNNPVGISSSIPLGVTGTVAGVEVEVDIAHFSSGNLVVELRGPSGRVVTLHNRTGGVSDNIQGTWPTTLTVDGPGGLDDFIGDDAVGSWTLSVRDLAFGATGRLQGWSVHLLVAPGGLSASGDRPGVPTRIVGNAPNPFNPRTTIAFDLAVGGKARLDIYDVRGRLVARLVDADLPAGRHTAVWQDPGVASGVYFARLSADGRTEVHKMTLLR